jgi:hypothetical protein
MDQWEIWGDPILPTDSIDTITGFGKERHGMT